MPGNILNLLIGGEAGQGLVTVGQILAKSLVRSGYFIVVTQDYQSRIRGGHNTFAIRVSDDEIAAPQESVDLLVALNEETIMLHRNRLSSSGKIIADEKFAGNDDAYIKVPFKKLSDAKFSNIVSLGVIGSILGLKKQLIAGTMKDYLGGRHSDTAEQNQKALANAYNWARTVDILFMRLKRMLDPPPRLMMNGNEAIALGALSAGLKFYSFYPMTPATSIALTLAANSEQMGLIVEQVEDEIAAINMSIGASFTGAPSMVGTSGGGFALMVEGISLAAMTETPVAIVVAQRPAPATGLPTRTEQADLEFILHAGHGEFSRAIFAPCSVKECFHLIRKALDTAERYHTPVFLLTDQFLADSYRAVEPFEVTNMKPLNPSIAAVPPLTPYKRYAITESGVSPRLLPGQTEYLVVADSDEHTEDGHITEDLSVRKQMVEKRLRKMDGIIAEVIPPEVQGDDNPDLLLVSWGSSKGAVLEAESSLRSYGKNVATMHFSQVWPLVPEQFLAYLEEAGQVVGIESNAFGQFARLLRRETGFHIEKQILRYDGLPITPDYILRELNRL